MRCSFGNRAGGTRQTRRTGGFSVIFKLIAATVSRCSGLQPLLRIQLAARMLTVLGVAAWATLIAAPASAISFTATSSMASSRTEASSTLLGNGKVLVAGGLNGLIVSSAELYDPAAGTAGFLVAAYNHMRLANSSPGAIGSAEVDGKPQRRGLGDKLSAAQVSALNSATFFGNDVDPKMVRLATMNLTLRGLPDVRILLRNVLTTALDAAQKAELGIPADGYHVVLANPPFSGRVDKDRIVDDVKVGTTTATELLFLKYMLDSLRHGGRCGVIVPEGVLFGSTGAHKELRRQLIENHRVEAVLSLPGGVFQPYSGVKTSVLFFKKGGRTERVLFLHADFDGYKLDANHDTPVADDDLPDAASEAPRMKSICPPMPLNSFEPILSAQTCPVKSTSIALLMATTFGFLLMICGSLTKSISRKAKAGLSST